MNKYLAEFIATYTMLLAILEGILLAANAHSGMATLVTASLVSGIAVAILIYGFAKISGAHMNPAVSTAMWLDNQLNTKQLFGYVTAQLLGSFLAAWTIDITHQDAYYIMGSTIPALSEGYAWILEAAMTFILMIVIFRFSDKRYPQLNKWTGVAVGAVITLEIYFGGPYSGASMNPARSFGPAVIEGQTMFHWLYFSAPVVGASIARYVDLKFRAKSVLVES